MSDHVYAPGVKGIRRYVKQHLERKTSISYSSHLLVKKEVSHSGEIKHISPGEVLCRCGDHAN